MDISSQGLKYVVEDDLSLFDNLETLVASDNLLPLARLGSLPNLKKLHISCNEISSLDLDITEKYSKLEVFYIYLVFRPFV